MSDEQIQILLDRWEEYRERGEVITIEELCGDNPALLGEVKRHLQTLELMDGFLARDLTAAAGLPEWTREGQDDLAATMIVGGTTNHVSAGASPTIPGYEILGELGRGGMGVVYKARQTALNRMVALKMVLAGACADASARARFVAEARAIAKLQHPHIVQVYDVGEYNGQPYFSMEFVEGGSLSQKLAGIPQSPDFAAETVLRLSRAMQVAHDRGIIHRDLKPANVLLAGPTTSRSKSPDQAGGSSSKGGTSAASSPSSSAAMLNPKITDFGLAKELGAESGQTQSGDVLGTPSYMAPEQALGNIRDITAATDVYALGAILYELLCGRPPLRGRNAIETVRMVVSQEPAAPTTIVPQIPRDLETICLKCLQKEPAKRYSTADALGDDLQRFLNGEPIAARPISTTERLYRWCRRNQVVASLMALVFIALCTGTVVSSYFAWQASEKAESEGIAKRAAQSEGERAKQSAEAAEKASKLAQERELQAIEAAKQETTAKNLAEQKQREATAAKEEVARKAKELESQVYRGKISLAHRELQAKNVPRAIQILQETDPKRRDWEWMYCWRIAHGAQSTFWTDPYEPFVGVDFRPDGVRVASAGTNGIVVVRDAVTGNQIFKVQVPRDEQFLVHMRLGTVRWTPDGSKLVVAGLDNTIKLLDGRNGTIISSLEGFQRGVSSIAVSPDGKYVAGCGGQEGYVESYEIRVYELATGKLVSKLLGHRHVVYGIAFSPDSSLLASAAGDNFVKLWNPATGEELRTLTGHSNLVNNVSFSPDGRRLVSAGRDGLALVWDIASLEPIGTLKGHDGEVMGAAFAPDGKRIATSGRDGTLKFWDLLGRLQFTLAGHGGDVMSLSFSPDGSRIASASTDGTVRIWTTGSDKQFVELGRMQLPLRGCAIDQSGNRLVAFGPQTEVFLNEYAVWDIPSRRMLRNERMDAGYCPFKSVDMSRDGRLALTCGGFFVNLSQVRLWEPESGRIRWTATDVKSMPECCAIDPIGEQVVVGYQDGRLEIRDLSDGRLLSEVQGHKNLVAHVRYSPGGEWLVTIGVDQTYIWDRSGNIKLSIASAGGGYVGPPVAFRSDGKVVAVIGEISANANWPERTAIRVIEIETGRVISTMRGHVRDITSLDFTPGGQRLASGAYDNRIKIWDADTGDELLTLSGHTAAVTSVRFTPDGRSLISTGDDGAVLLWDATPPETATWLPPNNWPSELAPVIDELCMVNPEWPGIVRNAHEIRSPEGNQFRLDLSGHLALKNIAPLARLSSLQSRGLTLSLDLSGTRVSDLSPLAATPLRELRLRGTPIRSLAPIQELPLEVLDVRQTPMTDLGPSLQRLAKSLKILWCDPIALPSHEQLDKLPSLSQVNETPLAEILAASRQEVVLKGHSGEVRSVALHPNGRLVASAGTDGTVRVWSLATGRHDVLAESPQRRFGPVIWSADGQSLIWSSHSTARDMGSEIVVWDVSGKRIVTRHPLTDVVNCLAAVPKQRQIVCGSLTGAMYQVSIDESGGAIEISPAREGLEVLSVAVSSDGQRLAVGLGRNENWTSPGEFQIWNLPERKQLANVATDSAYRCMAFAPDQYHVALAGASRYVVRMDIEAPLVWTAQSTPHDGRARELRFITADLLASAGEDDSLVLVPLSPQPRDQVKPPAPEEMIHFKGHSGPLWSVSCTPDGNTLATGGADGTVRIWNRQR